MAEIPDPPSTQPSKVGSMTGISPLRSDELLASGNRDRASETSASLSILALMGFGLSLLYALLVTLGGLASFYLHVPQGLFALLVLGPPLIVWGTLLVRGKKASASASTTSTSSSASVWEGAGAGLTYAAMTLAGSLTLLGLLGLIGFSAANPLLLWKATFFLPLAGVLTGWLALVQIARSEGSLGGRTLARWGIGLGIFFGLYYTLYYAGTYFAVRTQATEVAEDWFRRLAEGKTTDAYLLLLRPGERQSDTSKMRSILEAKNGSSSVRQPGMYTSFSQSVYVRLLQQGGSPRWMLERFDWQYEQTGYQARLTYQVKCDLGTLNLTLELQATETAGTRQWHIVPGMIGVGGVTLDRKWESSIDGARRFALEFLTRLSYAELEGAYLSTLSPKKRREGLRWRSSTSAALGLGWLGAQGANHVERLAYMKEQAKFQAGELVHTKGEISGEEFWAQKASAEIISQTKQFFDLSKRTGGIEFNPLSQLSIPLWKREQDKVIAGFYVQYPVTVERATRIVGAMLILEGEMPGDTVAGNWRVRNLELIRGLTAVAAAEGP